MDQITPYLLQSHAFLLQAHAFMVAYSLYHIGVGLLAGGLLSLCLRRKRRASVSMEPTIHDKQLAYNKQELEKCRRVGRKGGPRYEALYKRIEAAER